MSSNLTIEDRQAFAAWFTAEKRRPAMKNRAKLLHLFAVTKKEEFTHKLQKGSGGVAATGNVVMTPQEYQEYMTTHVVVMYGNLQCGVEVGDYDESTMSVDVTLVTNGRGADVAAIDIYQPFFLKRGMIENYVSEETTTYGRYLLNYVVLASIFGDKIPYVNTTFKISKIEEQIATKVLSEEITAAQVGAYLDWGFFLGTMSEICVPVFSEKSLVPPPGIDELKKRLLKEFADKLDDPVVGAMIEDKCIALDKEWLKGDPSMGFYGSDGKKTNVHRKRQYLMFGLVPKFQKEAGAYEFVTSSLTDGWEREAIPTFCNDIRMGSYSRGIETANGGVETKRIIRLLQNLHIVADDCGTSRGLQVHLTEANIKDYLGRNVVSGKGYVTITSRNKSTFIGKTWTLRSFMYCQQEGGYCYTCGGENYRTLGVDAIGTLALDLGAAFLTMSMKAMHGTKLSNFVIDDLDEFVID